MKAYIPTLNKEKIEWGFLSRTIVYLYLRFYILVGPTNDAKLDQELSGIPLRVPPE